MGSWKKAGDGIWVRVYTFNGNPQHSSAIALGGGGLMVLSPGTDLNEADFAELDALGSVKALVSPGAYHNMGLPAWSKRYPAAGVYGPAAAAKHIAKAHPSLPPVHSLDALKPLLPAEVEVFEVDGCAQPDAHVVVRRSDGTTWFTNEIITNWAAWPSSLAFKLVFKLTGASLGLDVSTMALLFIRGKKPAVKAYFEGKLASHPPTRLVPCHGDVLFDPNLKTRLAEVIGRRLG